MDRDLPIGDYSLLMNSIEGKLDSYVNQNSSDISFSNRIFSPTSRVAASKRRIEYTTTSSSTAVIDTPGAINSVPIQDFNLSTGKKLRLAVEADELRIQNEKLAEKMERIESDHERLKEKFLRQ